MSSQRSSGGRGGKQRLALLLTALWVASRPPHTSQRAASWWADMVGLAEPRSRVATRSVNQNFKELAARGFVDLVPGTDGYPATVRLRSELGAGAEYVRPKGFDGIPYFRAPASLWTSGRLGEMDGPALAMYLVLLSYHNATAPSQVWFSDSAFNLRHGLGENTRLGGLNQLVNLGVATMTEEHIDAHQSGGYRTIRRRYYQLEPSFTPPPRARNAAPTSA